MGRGSLARAMLGVAAAIGATVACGLNLAGTGSGSDAGSDANGASTNSNGGPGGPTGDGSTAPRDSGVDAFNPGYANRVTDGLMALYEMEEATGSTVHDSTPQHFDLTIDKTDPAHLQWQAHYMTVVAADSKITSAGNFDALTQACQASHEWTVEAWVALAGQTQGNQDYGRIATMAPGDQSLQLAIGTFKNTAFWTASAQNENVNGATVTPKQLTHVVGTRASDGSVTLFVNAVVASTATASTDPSDWSSNNVGIANTVNETRGVPGDYHLVAFYSRALTSPEVYQNFTAGADP